MLLNSTISLPVEIKSIKLLPHYNVNKKMQKTSWSIILACKNWRSKNNSKTSREKKSI